MSGAAHTLTEGPSPTRHSCVHDTPGSDAASADAHRGGNGVDPLRALAAKFPLDGLRMSEVGIVLKHSVQQSDLGIGEVARVLDNTIWEGGWMPCTKFSLFL